MTQGTTTGMGQGSEQGGDGTRTVADAIEGIEQVRDARPNILMILVDQLYYPQRGYGDAGFAEGIKQVLDFVGDIDRMPPAVDIEDLRYGKPIGKRQIALCELIEAPADLFGNREGFGQCETPDSIWLFRVQAARDGRQRLLAEFE